MTKGGLAEPARKRCYLTSVRVKNLAKWRQCMLDLNTDLQNMSRDNNSELPCGKAQVVDDFCRKICSQITEGMVSHLISTCHWMVSNTFFPWQEHPVLPVLLKVYGQKFTQYSVFCRLLLSCNCAKESTAWAFKKLTWSYLRKQHGVHAFIC